MRANTSIFFFKIILILPSKQASNFHVASLLEASLPKFCVNLPSSPTCYVHHPSHQLPSDHSNKIRRREQIMELLRTQFLQCLVTKKQTNKQTNNDSSRFSKAKETSERFYQIAVCHISICV